MGVNFFQYLQTLNEEKNPGSFAIRTKTKIDHGKHKFSNDPCFKTFDEEEDNVITIENHKFWSFYNKCTEFEKTDFGKEMKKRLD